MYLCIDERIKPCTISLFQTGVFLFKIDIYLIGPQEFSSSVVSLIFRDESLHIEADQRGGYKQEGDVWCSVTYSIT